jgi:trigger factor
MKVEVTDHNEVKKTLTVEVGPEVVEKETTEVVRYVGKQAQVPGFRKGKVPEKVVRSRFNDQIREDVQERLLGRLFREVATERGYQPIGDPKLDELKFEPGEPFRFVTTFEVLPKFEVDHYKGVSVEQMELVVDDKEIDKILDELSESRAKLTTIDEAGSTGDFLIADLHGEPEEGEPFDHERAFVEIGSTQHLPEFNQRVEGAKAGDELAFSVTFPEEYETEALRGKAIAYKLKVHEVKKKEIPVLDDEFAKDLGEFETIDALREQIRSDLMQRKLGEQEADVRQKIMDQVLQKNPIVLPEVLVNEEIRLRLEDVVRRMISQGMDPQKEDIDWEQFRKGAEEPARKTVHARMVLEAIAAVEKLVVPPKELDERIRQEAARIGEDAEVVKTRLKEGHRMEALTDQLRRERALDLLVSVANIQPQER